MTVSDGDRSLGLLSSSLSSAIVRRWPLILLMVLVPIYSVGLFSRGIWTPDEPREIALSWNMVHQSDKAVPQLGDEAYCEKPTLSYWMAGASMSVFGKSPSAARAPGLLYGLIGAFSLAFLAYSLAIQTVPHNGNAKKYASVAALSAGIIFGTMEITWQVAVWLASDAPLLMGACIALLGAWRGAQAEPGSSKLRWYLLMHLGMLIGFFSKNIIGWITPMLALGVWLAWEGRLRELCRWELWIGFLLQLCAIVPWILWVMKGPDGMEHLRVIFVENLVGRFLPWFKGTKDYNSGHSNFPGKYLLEMPAYLLPWLLIACAALWKSWSACRVPGFQRPAWRFALCIIIPNLLLLSAASTGRGIYLAPLFTGFAVLMGLWAASQIDAHSSWDRRAIIATGFLISSIAVLIFPIIYGIKILLPSYFSITHLSKIDIAGIVIDQQTWILFGVCSVMGVIKMVMIAGHYRRNHYGMIARESVVTLLVLWVFVGMGAPRIVDRWQDLRPVAAKVSEHAVHQRMMIINTDETTRAIVQYYTGLSLPYTEEDVEGRPDCLALRKMPSNDTEYARTSKELYDKGWQEIDSVRIVNGRSYAIFAGRSIHSAP